MARASQLRPTGTGTLSIRTADGDKLIEIGNTDQHMGFFGAAVVAQPTTIADVAALTGGEPPTEAEFNALASKFNDLLAKLEALGLLASS